MYTKNQIHYNHSIDIYLATIYFGFYSWNAHINAVGIENNLFEINRCPFDKMLALLTKHCFASEKQKKRNKKNQTFFKIIVGPIFFSKKNYEIEKKSVKILNLF